MATQRLMLLAGLVILSVLTVLPGSTSENRLWSILGKRDVGGAAGAPSDASVVVPSSTAKDFLSKLSRTKRQLWDRSRPDVQQWIMQAMQMGFDEQRLEADLSYWMDHARANDQGRQHHYDENAPMGPRDSASYRHGANVNYDYY